MAHGFNEDNSKASMSDMLDEYLIIREVVVNLTKISTITYQGTASLSYQGYKPLVIASWSLPYATLVTSSATIVGASNDEAVCNVVYVGSGTAPEEPYIALNVMYVKDE